MNALSTISDLIAANAYDSAFSALYPDVSYQRERYIRLIGRFSEEFGEAESALLLSSPGRTEIGGNHTDHQRGRVLAASISLDAIAVAAPASGRVVRIVSDGYPTEEIWLSNVIPDPAEKGTSRALIRGIIAKYAELGCICNGFNAVISSDVLPGSGLSSSAAYEILICMIINRLFANGRFTPVQMAQIACYAENLYFGKPCGLMDQMACAIGGAVAIDFCDAESPEVRKIDVDSKRLGYGLCIIDTGGTHADLTAEYASIPSEMRSVARYFGKQSLRDITAADVIENMAELRRKLSDRAVTRSLHFFAENERAGLEAEALLGDDIQRFLDLVNESGRSSFMYLQNIFNVSTPSVQPLSVALALCGHILGDRGAFRVHGGGFAGTIQAFVPLDMLDGFRESIEKALGKGCCHVLTIRPCGVTELKP